MNIVASQAESRIVVRSEPEWKAKVETAAETRDGGNVSRMVRRAIDKLIEDEQLLPSQSDPRQEVA